MRISRSLFVALICVVTAFGAFAHGCLGHYHRIQTLQQRSAASLCQLQLLRRPGKRRSRPGLGLAGQQPRKPGGLVGIGARRGS